MEKKEKEEGSKEKTTRSSEESCGVLTGSCNNEFIPRARTLLGYTTFLSHFACLLRILINENAISTVIRSLVESLSLTDARISTYHRKELQF